MREKWETQFVHEKAGFLWPAAAPVRTASLKWPVLGRPLGESSRCSGKKMQLGGWILWPSLNSWRLPLTAVGEDLQGFWVRLMSLWVQSPASGKRVAVYHSLYLDYYHAFYLLRLHLQFLYKWSHHVHFMPQGFVWCSCVALTAAGFCYRSGCIVGIGNEMSPAQFVQSVCEALCRSRCVK